MIHPDSAGDALSSRAAAAPPPDLERAQRLDLRPSGAEPSGGHLRLLLVEDNPSDAEIARDRLAECTRTRFEVVHETRLSSALARLAAGGIDVVLLDLDLPDSRGVATAERILDAHPDVPVVVLTGNDDEAAAVRAVRRGAQDFLMKDRLDPEFLPRALRYAVERHAMIAEVELAASEARDSAGRLHKLIGLSAEGFLVLDESRTLKFVNPAAENLLGRPADELLGCTLSLPLGGGERQEVLVPRPDGASFPAEMRVVSLEWEGRQASLVSLYDLSDRKRAERVSLAQSAQRAFLPERMSLRVGSLSMFGRNELCEDASGDYYDFLEIPGGRVAIAVGDVTGHGLVPALLMAQGRASLRAFSRTLRDLRTVMRRLNDALAADMTEGRFMSLFLAFADPADGSVCWCNAGHVPPAIYRAATGEVERLEATALVLGIRSGLSFKSRSTTLAPGDVLLLCSDGAVEASRADGERYGMDRLLQALKREVKAAPEAIVDAVRADIDRFTGGRPLEDDLTLVAIRRAESDAGTPPAPSARSSAAGDATR